MSTKETIFLTNDCNEHCYIDSSYKNYKNNKYIGDSLVLEMDKENINILIDDEDDLVLEFINPNSEIYKTIQKLKQYEKLQT